MRILLRLYVLSAAALLLASGLVHLLNTAGHAQVLALPEPLLGLPLRYGLPGAAALEITVALVCLLGKRPGLQLLWLAWMGTNLLVYHVGLIWSGCHLECTALGYPTDPLHLSRSTAVLLLNAITIYVSAGSYAALVFHWFLSRKNPSIQKSTNPSPALPVPQPQPGTLNPQLSEPSTSATNSQPSTHEYLKMSCPHCSGHISFPAQRLGQTIPCPHCSKALTLESARSEESQRGQAPKLPAAITTVPSAS